MDLRQLVALRIEKIEESINIQEINAGKTLFCNGECQILSRSARKFEFIISADEDKKSIEVILEIDDETNIIPFTDKKVKGWDRYSYGCLLQLADELKKLDPSKKIEHKQYSREGMIQRVLAERKEKALKANYRIKWADNIHGDHILTNERGVKYKVFLRDFENETGYSDNMDSRVNKLGTSKHIMYAFQKLKTNAKLYAKLSKTYPFIEIFLDPLNDYKITWHYPYELPTDEQLFISRYFGNSNFIEDSEVTNFLGFIRDTRRAKNIVIRPEVREKIEDAFENKLLEDLQSNHKADFSPIKADLFDYQKEGILFSLYKKAAIIADEMGLGKTIQAIAAAILKKELFGFKHAMVVCPASLKDQWKREIERFSDEKALVIQGFPHEREKQYITREEYFIIVNYETVLRDQVELDKAEIDFLILDEAQRVKNYATKTAAAIKNINKKHVLVITGTPIENRLIDLFSILSILDPYFLGPLWEFSYQHCLFDPGKYNKINGYYNLQQLKQQLSAILLRREKRKVLDQLPNLQQANIPVSLSPLQSDYHGSYARSLAQILHKKFLTAYDMQRVQVLLANMRMVCDSTYLVDGETNESPKLDELTYILLEKLDVKNTNRKIIIFSEWVKMHKLIGRVLRENDVEFVELNGSIPVKSRGELIKKFETADSCKIFLSTEAGGSGLNLQVADILINFELPWNPAKKNQRIGRIDRLGQKSNKLTILNFITRFSIEERIAAGLVVKQNLFEGVLDESSNTNFVDFSAKGRSQFLQQLEDFVSSVELKTEEEEAIEEEMQKPVDEKPAEISGEQPRDQSTESEEMLEEEAEAEPENKKSSEPASGKTGQPSQQPVNPQEFEQVMNNGLQFISGLFKLSTGKDPGMENQKIEVNKETGEVTMKFKLPV